MVEQMALNFETFEAEIISPLCGVEMTELEMVISTLLLDATSERPMSCALIIEKITAATGKKIVERHVKEIVRKLRKIHGFPILARRVKPVGYWWCGSIDEMSAFVNVFKSQAMDELHTLSKMVKQHYPALAGQLNFTNLEN